MQLKQSMVESTKRAAKGSVQANARVRLNRLSVLGDGAK